MRITSYAVVKPFQLRYTATLRTYRHAPTAQIRSANKGSILRVEGRKRGVLPDWLPVAQALGAPRNVDATVPSQSLTAGGSSLARLQHVPSSVVGPQRRKGARRREGQRPVANAGEKE